MKKILVLFVGIFMLGFCAKAQNFRTLIPEGYNILKAWQDKDVYVEADFNNDQLKDYFLVIEKGEETKFMILLNSNKGLQVQEIIPFRRDDFYCCGSIELLPKNVIKLGSLGNRHFEYYKFRYDNNKKQFRIIGFDYESLMDINSGYAYWHSFNLITRKSITTTVYNDFETGEGHSKSEKKHIKGLGKFYLKDFSICTQQVQGFLRDN